VPRWSAPIFSGTPAGGGLHTPFGDVGLNATTAQRRRSVTAFELPSSVSRDQTTIAVRSVVFANQPISVIFNVQNPPTAKVPVSFFAFDATGQQTATKPTTTVATGLPPAPEPTPTPTPTPTPQAFVLTVTIDMREVGLGATARSSPPGNKLRRRRRTDPALSGHQPAAQDDL
jgi:hypothetical protein